MSTRTNFYKNPSVAYKKDFSLSSVLRNLRAYNVAAGNAPPIDEQPPAEKKTTRTKRRRLEPEDRRREIRGENDGPMSHQDYIESRRNEACSCKVYQELDADVLEATGSGSNLVGYESESTVINSDENVPSECRGDDTQGKKNEGDHIRSRNQQRSPLPGEPSCVVCGRYGEYICDERPLRNQNASIASSVGQSSLPAPDLVADTWDYYNHCWSKKRSALCTYECWKCQRPGHVADDCLVTTSDGQKKSIPRYLFALYRRCYQIGKDISAASCNTCRSTLSLATCLDCSTVLCDDAGHVDEHISRYPSHQQYYSHKLRRLVKCCKSTCKVTEIKDLLVCHHCFDKAFDRFYDMYTATWRQTGLSIIKNAICCEDHFAWHRMNCSNADVEDVAYIVNKNTQRGNHVQLSDFIF